MKNKKWIIVLLILIAVGFCLYYFFNYSNDNNTSNYVADKTEATTGEDTNTSKENADESNPTDSYNTENTNNIDNTNNDEQNNEDKKDQDKNQTHTETEISSFTTKIYTKDSNRQKNISITCSTLNDTFVANGETFSFCNTVGQATSSKGYQKAEIFDAQRSKDVWSWGWQLSNKYYFI